MIFVPKTPRFLTLEKARRVRAAIPKGVLAVGVFRDPKPVELARYQKELKLDAVQVYRGKRCELRTRRSRFPLIEPPRTDASRRSGKKVSDAARLRAWKTAPSRRRAVLAGGLTPKNAAAAAALRPYALDVSSGVESRPGIKSARLLRAFFAAVRDA
jgi:phosphoribosylanthranilate isomerase